MKTGSQYMVPLFLLLSQETNIQHNKATSATATFTSSVAFSTHAPHPLTEEPSSLTQPQAREFSLKKACLKAVKQLKAVEQFTSVTELMQAIKALEVNASFLEYADLTAVLKEASLFI